MKTDQPSATPPPPARTSAQVPPTRAERRRTRREGLGVRRSTRKKGRRSVPRGPAEPLAPAFEALERSKFLIARPNLILPGRDQR